jgi:ribosomal-protein-alanine N-acetyltransferase
MAGPPKLKSAGKRPTAPFRIRPARPADAAALASIEQASFADPWGERDFAACLERGLLCFVADARGRLEGYVIANQGADEAEILNLGVLPERRRRGIGRAMVTALLAALASHGAKAVFLEVRASNEAAQALYREFRFLPVGRRSRYYQHPTEDAVILRAAIAAA